MNIGWHFPVSGGGVYDGFNDSGIETFAGNRFQSLAREVLQNSLDAKAGEDKVTVEFDVVRIAGDDFPGRETLIGAVQNCSKSPAVRADPKASGFFKRAEKILKGDGIPCLRIRDIGTTGLQGKPNDPQGQWGAITKGRGISAQKASTAGGSYGIGKNAPFAVSDLRTVFYSTRYKENGKAVERAQGKSILTGQPLRDGYTTGAGFYGVVDGTLPLEDKNIPALLRNKVDGTQILVAGFSGDKDWQDRITAAVVANFFYAIDQEMLEVLIQGESGDPLIIEASSLSEVLRDRRIAQDDGVKNAGIYYRVSKESENERDMQVQHLGACRLWTRIGESLPKKVALLRKTGMLITDEQRGLKKWPGFSDFASVCICNGDDGNEMLRSMESPQHNAFEPDRLDDPEQKKKGEKALKALVDKIRKNIKALAVPETSGTTALTELEKFFPDQNPDETLPGEGEERDLEGAPFYQLKPIKTKPESLIDVGEDGDEGGGGGQEPGGGTGTGGSGDNKGGRKSTASANIEKVRVLHTSDDARNKTIMFTPLESGEAKIALHIAGDSGLERLPISEVRKGGTLATSRTSVITVNMKDGKRMFVEVTLQEPVMEAIAIVAFKNQEKA